MAHPSGSRPGGWSVERTAHPRLLSWEFFQDPSEAWDSAAITIRLKPGVALSARILSWPASGPWSAVRPAMVSDTLGVRLRAWSRPASGDERGRPALIVTFSVELADGARGFADVEEGIAVEGFPGAALAAGPVRPAPRAARTQGRDALGRYRPEASKWALMAATMRGEAWPSP